MNFEGKPHSLLTFRVGPVLCCAPSLPVRSIITPPKLTRIAGSESSQPGIFRYDSKIVNVFDLRQKFGIELAEQTQPGNLIITFCGKENFAFWVDQILDVFDFPTEGWSNLPAAIPRGIFSHTLLLNKTIHLYSEFEKLATIKDLGYLKHYIQKLTQEENKTTPTETIKTNDIVADIKPGEKVHVAKPLNKPTPTTKIIDGNSEQSKTVIHKKPIPKKAYSQNTPTNSDATNNVTAQKKITAPVIEVDKKRQTTSNVLSSRSYQKEKHQLDTNKTRTPSFKIQTTTTNKKEHKKNNSYQPSSHYNKSSDEDVEISYTGIIVFFLLLLGALVGGFYTLFSDSFTHSNDDKKESYVDQSESTTDPLIESYYLSQSSQAKTTTAPQQSHDQPTIFSFPSAAVDKTDTDKPITAMKPAKNTQYRANITQDDNEITITVHQPDIKEQPQQPHVVEDMNEAVRSTKPIPVKVQKQNELNISILAKNSRNEIIHTVVKGDTLWAIAKKYVNNPFLYPELARLSNIKNPHRIYPGNQVRIRFIKN